MSNVTFPSGEEIDKMTNPMLGRFIREQLGHDPTDMDVGQRRTFVKTKAAEAAPKPTARRGRKKVEDQPLTHTPMDTPAMAELKNKVAAGAGAVQTNGTNNGVAVALAASLEVPPALQQYLIGLERRIATCEAGIGIAAGRAAPPVDMLAKFDKLAAFITRDNDGGTTVTMGEDAVDAFTMEMCLQACMLFNDQDATPDTPIRVLKQRIKAKLRAMNAEHGTAPQPAPINKPTQQVAKPPAPAAPVPSAATLKHGDLIKAVDADTKKVFEPARVLRVNKKAKTIVVHWGAPGEINDTFAEISEVDVKGMSTKEWKLAEEPADLEVDFS